MDKFKATATWERLSVEICLPSASNIIFKIIFVIFVIDLKFW
jgi:hypothetical protein